MSDFWLGVFSGLVVWTAFDTLITLALLGTTAERDMKTVATGIGLVLVFMIGAWWHAMGF